MAAIDGIPAYSPDDLGLLSININKKPRRFSAAKTVGTSVSAVVIAAGVYFASMIYNTAVAPLSITIPDPKESTTGQLIQLKADTNANSVKWKSRDPALSIVQDTDFTKATVTSDVPGVYTVHAVASRHGHTPYSSQQSDFIPVKVTIKAKGPTPAPLPPGPTPSGDPFQTTLQAAYKIDGSPSADAMALASLLAMGAKTTANDPAITTLSALFAKLHGAEDNLEALPTASKSKLLATRTAIAGELTAKLGDTTKATPLTADLRAACAEQFTRMAALLNGLK